MKTILSRDNIILKKTHGEDRTRNLPIRSRTPYPFGHGGIYRNAIFCLKKKRYEIAVDISMKPHAGLEPATLRLKV